MLTQFIRVFKKKNAVTELIDLSVANSQKSGMDLTDLEYLLIAQKFPFQNLFLLLKDVATNTDSKMKVEYWSSKNEWTEALDVLDSSNGLQNHGMIQFSRTKQETWKEIFEAYSDSTDLPDEIKGLNVNRCYWIKISFDNQPTNASSVSLKKIGYAFTDTNTINSVDFDAPKYYATIGRVTGETNKANWINEILTASEMMIAEMKTYNILKAPGQIIQLDDFFLPCAYRTLQLIYFSLGAEAYKEKLSAVAKAYATFLSGYSMPIDKDQDGELDKSEQTASFIKMER